MFDTLPLDVKDSLDNYCLFEYGTYTQSLERLRVLIYTFPMGAFGGMESVVREHFVWHWNFQLEHFIWH